MLLRREIAILSQRIPNVCSHANLTADLKCIYLQTEPPKSRGTDAQLPVYMTRFTSCRVMIVLRLGSKIGGENKRMSGDTHFYLSSSL